MEKTPQTVPFHETAMCLATLRIHILSNVFDIYYHNKKIKTGMCPFCVDSKILVLFKTLPDC